MTLVEVSFSRFSLTVDAFDTIRAVLESGNTPWGRRLHDALIFATTEETAYAVAPYVPVRPESFCPGAPERGALPDVADWSVGDVLRKLESSGFVSTHTIWSETSGQAYLSDGRTVTAVHVLRPFALLGVHYSFSYTMYRDIARHGYVYADQWKITDRTYIVPAGWYVMGEIGDYSRSLVGVTGIAARDDAHPDDIAEHLAYWVSEIDGFGAAHCGAGCDACGGQWLAESGSWHFTPDDDTNDGWDFDNADDFDERHTIACPSCGTGRVGFLIF
jgi:hypothetical protein